MIRRGYDLDDTEFATAVAASAHAIHSLGQNTRTNRQTHEPFRPPQGGMKKCQTLCEGSLRMPSTTRATGQDSSFVRPTVPLPENQRLKQISWGIGSSGAKTDAWEKAQIAKIRKRHEKMQSEILAWENENKLREKRQMERKKDELEQRKSRNLKHYYNKVARIDHLAGGARAQLDEKRKHEEFIVKEKARKMRSTGKTPDKCFCF